MTKKREAEQENRENDKTIEKGEMTKQEKYWQFVQWVMLRETGLSIIVSICS